MIFKDLNFRLKISYSLELKSFKLIFSIANISVSKNIFSLLFTIKPVLSIELFFPLIQNFLVLINLIHKPGKFLPNPVYVLISIGDSLSNLLPFREETVSLFMLLLEFLSRLIQLNLACLGGCDFFFKLLLFSTYLNCKLFYLKVKLSDLSIVLFSIFL